MEDNFFTDGLIDTAQNRGTPTLNGNSGLGWFGNTLDALGGLAGKAAPLVSAIKGPGNAPAAKATTTLDGKSTGFSVLGMSGKTLLIVGGVIVAGVAALLIFRKK